MRCINVINFIRGVEPRGPVDLLQPVERQLDEIRKRSLPATWLLQYDALEAGTFVDMLKRRMPADHEAGLWFEMNEKLVNAAGVRWRGRPGFEWDSQPSVAFSIGYSVEERAKLVDAAMAGFRAVWGRYPRSVASWNLDAISMARMVDRFGVEAFAVCRDQIATDGFTIWGAPIAGYYPSRTNCWSPALDRKNQIGAPVLRMLGQDPVYYYNRSYPLPDGRRIGEPDTMEPVWTSGRSSGFVKAFLDMIAEAPCERFAYAQLGQENSFGWPSMQPAYGMQMDALAHLRKTGAVHVETMGATGRRFRSAFSATPVQSQVMLMDPFVNTPAQKTVWYQSRFYRANLHVRGNLPFFRDVTVYSDELPQPFLQSATRESDVEQRLPAVIDGYHWASSPGSLEEPTCGGFLSVGDAELRLAGDPRVSEHDDSTLVELPIVGGSVGVRFIEHGLLIEGPDRLALKFAWDPSRHPLPIVAPDHVAYTRNGFEYRVGVLTGRALPTADGWQASGGKALRLRLAQQI